jgi:RNA polymerase sigma-70 factor (ECF subfamily)
MTEHDQTVHDLVVRAQRGDPEAFAELYDLYADRLYRFARFRLGQVEDAEDVVQRVFLTVIENLPRYQHRGVPFDAWIFRIARNESIDLLRRRRPRDPLEAIAGRPATDPGPEDRAVEAIELVAVAQALVELTDEQREVIALRYFAGLSAAEAGAVMGKREGSIRALQFRAIASLRRTLGWEDER